MNFSSVLEDAAQRYPNHTVIKSEERELTYRQLNDDANRFARALDQKFDIQPGERVAGVLSNCAETVLAYFACAKLGAVYVPCNPIYKASELKDIIGPCEPRVILSAPDTAAMVRELRDKLDPTPRIINISEPSENELSIEQVLEGMPATNLDRSFPGDHPAAIFCTSGTTSQSKGAIWTHDAVVGSQRVVEAMDHHLQPDDVMLPYIPFFHAWGLVVFLRVILGGASLVPVRLNTPFRKLMQTIAEMGVTYLIAPSQMFHIIVNKYKNEADGNPLRSLRAAQAGASALDPNVWRAFEERFQVPLMEVYGMTECGYICSNKFKGPRIPHSVGSPAPFTEVKIVDDDLKEVSLGNSGQIIMQGPSVVKGFFGLVDNLPFTPDGWLMTGDVGKMDEFGNVYILDRAKDIVNVHGEKVYCIEIEQVLKTHPKVADASVVSFNSGKNEVPVACLIGHDKENAASTEDILDHCRSRLAAFKVPRQFFFMDEFPRNSLGKVVKKQLREIVEQSRKGKALSAS